MLQEPFRPRRTSVPEKQRVSATIEIKAPPEVVYAMVTDLPRMGEWSPENVGGSWIGGQTRAVPGARFRGRNKNGKRSWTGEVVVGQAIESRRFEFTTIAGPIKFATWSYDITPAFGGCTLTETWVDTRPGLLGHPFLGKVFTSVGDRAAFTKVSIETTLANIKKAAEDPNPDW
jgi:polyketide cyclase/dehydrase/lipid transport protein